MEREEPMQYEELEEETYSKYTIHNLRKIIKHNNLHESFFTKYAKRYNNACKKDMIEHLKNNSNITIPEFLTVKKKEPVKEEINVTNEVQETIIEPIKEEEIQIINLKSENEDNKVLNDIQTKKPIIREIEVDPEEKLKQTNAKLKIERYQERFKWLKNAAYTCNKNNYVEYLEEVELKLSSKNSSQLVSSQFFVLTSGIENAANFYLPNYFKIRGFSENLRANQATHDLLDELQIKYSDSFASIVSPEKRLLILVLSTMYATHQNNVLAEEIKKIKQQTANPNIIDKAKGL